MWRWVIRKLDGRGWPETNVTCGIVIPIAHGRNWTQSRHGQALRNPSLPALLMVRKEEVLAIHPPALTSECSKAMFSACLKLQGVTSGSRSDRVKTPLAADSGMEQ